MQTTSNTAGNLQTLMASSSVDNGKILLDISRSSSVTCLDGGEAKWSDSALSICSEDSVNGTPHISISC